MPHKNSAKKALRKSDKRRLLHRSQKSTLRTLLRKFDAALEGDASAEEKQKLFSEVAKKLDQSAAKKLINGNKASRTKSRLAARLNKATNS